MVFYHKDATPLTKKFVAFTLEDLYEKGHRGYDLAHGRKISDDWSPIIFEKDDDKYLFWQKQNHSLD